MDARDDNLKIEHHEGAPKSQSVNPSQRNKHLRLISSNGSMFLTVHEGLL